MIAEAEGRLEQLRALRDRLATEIDTCHSMRDLAALSQRLMDVLSQIEAVELGRPESKGTPLDEVARRRAQRKAAAKSQARTASR